MSSDGGMKANHGRKRIVIKILGNQESVETPDGTYKLASPIWERGMYEVEVVPGEQVATARRLFGERFQQDVLRWLASIGHGAVTGNLAEIQNAGEGTGTTFSASVEEGIAIATRQAIDEIQADMEVGVVPADIVSFAQLHDYVDANGYGGAFDWPEGESFEESDEEYVLDTCAFWNAVQGGVDAWIKGGAGYEPAGRRYAGGLGMYRGGFCRPYGTTGFSGSVTPV